MRSVKEFSLFLTSLLIVSALSSANPAFAVTSSEITSISEGLKTDSGMIASAADLAGANSDLVKEFQLGVKYGEFATRFYLGDYWGVAADFSKFQLGREVDKLTDLASKKLLSAGAQRLVVVFTALKDSGIWLGNKALEWRFNEGVQVGYQLYKESGGDPAFMNGWWGLYSKAKLRDLGDFDVWMGKFAKVYALETNAKKAPVASADIVATEKAIKKVAIVHFFTLKYPGIENDVSEELADAIVNKAGSAAIKKIAEKYKNHLDGLTSKAESSAVSSTGICGVVKNKDNRKDCEKTLAKIVDYRNRVLANKTFFDQHWLRNESYMPYLDDIVNEKVAKFVKDQEDIIASAYEFQFAQEIRAINASFATNKDKYKNLYKVYKDLPEGGDHYGGNATPNYGRYDYLDFRSGDAQKYYQKYLANELKANAADDVREKYLKAHVGRLNGLGRDFTVLQNRINSLISSAESAQGVFSYGQTTIDDLKKIIVEIKELKKDVQSGEKYIWQWRSGGGSIDSTLGTIKKMESEKKARQTSIVQLKKDYALALKTYTEEEKQRKLEQEKLAEAKKTTAPVVTPSAAKKTTAPAVTPSAAKKTTAPAVTPSAAKKTTAPAQKNSTLPSGYSNIPNENVEMAGFSFISQGKAEMMAQDFFWSDVLYTVNGALDLGSKTLNDVTSVPASGYKADPYQPQVGHVYAIKTRGGKYGIIQIALVEAGQRLYFFWRYQSNGSTSFS